MEFFVQTLFKRNLKCSEMSTSLHQVRENLTNILNDDSKPWTPYFDVLEAKTSINRSVIFVGSLTLFGWWMIFGISEEFMSYLIGIVYPTFRSIHAIETTGKHNEIPDWLMYWIVFATFCFIEYFTGVLIDVIPYYTILKLTFLLWLMAPVENNGTAIIYRHVIKRFVAIGERDD